MKLYIYLLATLLVTSSFAQTNSVSGSIHSDDKPVSFASVVLGKTGIGTQADSAGQFTLKNLPTGRYQLQVSAIGFRVYTRIITIQADKPTRLPIELTPDNTTLNEVVITGVSRATELRKSPVAIAVINRREMNYNVNNNIVDAVLKGVPGMSAVTTGPNVSKPFIRGLGYNRVLTMYNGVRQEGQQWGDEHGIEVDQYGVERAEVVKGPASLIYGSDAVAGVINFIPYIPRGPEGKLKGDLIGEYHTNNNMIGTSLGLSYNKKGWKAFFRTSQKSATAYKNSVDGRVYGTAFNELNVSAMTGIEKQWGSSFVYATLYDNLQEIPAGSRDSLTRQFTRQVLENDTDDIKDRPLVPTSDLQTYRINPLHQHIQHYRLFTRSHFLFGKSDLTATIGFQQSIRREFNHPTVPLQAGLYVQLNTYNYDIKYNFPTWKGLETTLGLNGMYQTNKNLNGTDFPIPDYQLLDIGSFIFAKKSLGKLDISGGARYDTRTYNWADQYVQPRSEHGFDELVRQPTDASATLLFSAYQRSFKGFSGSLGATYNLSDRMMIKANLARGYRAPNSTEVGSNGLDPGAHIVYLGNRTFNPEFSLQTDIGFIAYLKEMDLSVELFNNAIENYIYQARLYDDSGNPVVIVPGNFTYKYQQSRAQLYGAEFNLNLHPQKVKWLAVNNSLALIRGLNRNDKLIAKEGDAARYLPFIPPLHGRSEIRASFNEPVGRLSGIYARAEVDYYGAQNKFYGVDNTETATPGYSLFGVGCGATVNNGKDKPLFQVFLQVENLFDTAYQSNLNRLKYFEYYTASPTGRSGIYNMGRNGSVKVIIPL